MGKDSGKKMAFMPAGEYKEISFILGLLKTTIGRQTAGGHQRTMRGSEYEYYTVGGGLLLILYKGPLEFLTQKWSI